MKTLLIILPCFLLVQTCGLQNTENNSAVKKVDNVQETNKIDPIAIGFDKEIKPIFIKNCSPCHFTGGKMYERLPFDKDTTIINHSAAILKRIKNEEENTLLSNFIDQNKNGLPEGKPH
jgi:hypothetical protein